MRSLSKQSVRRIAGRTWKTAMLNTRMVTSHLRALPHFVIIGGQKCGTTSLYNYLIHHPLILGAYRKEVHYFDLNFHKGTHWYRAFFPHIESAKKNGAITGEASPYYLFHPQCPERIHSLLPEAKLIVLLRNPVDRAYSHYWHEVRRGRETLTFEEAVDQERKRIQAEWERLVSEDHYVSYNYQHRSYLSRGLYADQLERWLQYFPKRQLLILKAEDLYESPSEIVREVVRFLGLPEFELPEYQTYNSGEGYRDMSLSLRERLEEYFAPHNQRLFENTGVKWVS